MRLLALASAAIVITGCTNYSSGDDYGLSYVTPVQSSGIYAGCATSVQTGCNAGNWSQANYTPQNYNSGCYQQSPCDTGYGMQQAATSYAYPTGHNNHANNHYYASSHHALRGPQTYYIDDCHNDCGPSDYFYGELGAEATHNLEDLGEVFGVHGKLGYQSASFVGAELEVSTGLSGTDAVFDYGMGDEAGDFKKDFSYGAFGVARIPLHGDTNVVLRAGYHKSKFKFKADNGTDPDVETEDSGYAVGAGLELPISRDGAIRSDTTYYDTDGSSFWATTVSYQHKF